MTILRRHILAVALGLALGAVAAYLWLSHEVGGALAGMAVLATGAAVRRRRAADGQRAADELEARSEDLRERMRAVDAEDAAADRRIETEARSAGERLPPEPRSAPRPRFVPPARPRDED